MSERDKILLGSWLGAVKIGDTELKPLGAGRYVALKALGNGHFSESSTGGTDMIMDSIEVILIMTMNGQEIGDYMRKSKSERESIVAEFAATHCDTIDETVATVMTRMQERIGAATMESLNDSGKEISRAS